MKCNDLLKMLNDYVDGDIDPAVCAQLQRHLKECDPCRVVVDNIRNTITLYRGAAEVCEIPLKFRQCLHDALRAKWEAKPRGRRGPARRGPRSS